MPQPDASSVIQKLLAWISRVDAASRANAARPSFADEVGGDIFPEGPWWLTDVSRRAEDEKAQVADEDGPPSDDDGQPAEVEVSDEDPLSEEDEPPRRYDPRLGWHSY